MRKPRGLSGDDVALWARVAATVKPINPPSAGEEAGGVQTSVPVPLKSRTLTRTPPPLRGPPPRAGEERKHPPTHHGLDAGWDRRLSKGAVPPDFTLDLHGHSLDAAWSRLEHGLTLAHSQGARVVLVITGRPRPADSADRGSKRGAIRAKLLDWLAAGSHAGKIAAVRGAHPRHGGAGAVYVVLKRGR